MQAQETNKTLNNSNIKALEASQVNANSLKISMHIPAPSINHNQKILKQKEMQQQTMRINKVGNMVFRHQLEKEENIFARRSSNNLVQYEHKFLQA
jgi:hypothetical protein